MRLPTAITISLLAASLAWAGSAAAQQGHDQHHPSPAESKGAKSGQMPMREGMPGAQGMPGGTMGPGMMMGGPGGMGPGMMGRGGMGHMMQGGMMQGGMMQGGMMQGGMMRGGMMQGGMMGRDCPMMGMMMGEGSGTTHADGRVAFLKAELKITEAQQPAFDDYAAALKKNLESMQSMRASMMERMQATSPAERLNARVSAMEARLTSLKAIKEPLDKLYAVLTDEQKKTADQILTGMGCMM